MRAKPFRFFVLSVIFIVGCGGSSAPPELEQAALLVDHFTTPSVLSRSTFPVVLPEGTPKQFVSWLFSGMGTAEWPPTKSMAMQDFGQPSVPGMPTLPDDVMFTHSKPDTSKGKQIVVKWDDARGVVIAEGYINPKSAPVLVKEYALPKITSTDQLARISAQGYLEMGGSYQAF